MPGNFEVKNHRGNTWTLLEAIELHRLVLVAQLERRKEEITEAIINSTCSMTIDDGYICKEVRQAPFLNTSPGDATVPCLHVQSLGLSAAESQQGR